MPVDKATFVRQAQDRMQELINSDDDDSISAGIDILVDALTGDTDFDYLRHLFQQLRDQYGSI